MFYKHNGTINEMKQPRCPEYNNILNLVEEICLSPNTFYGLDGEPSSVIEQKIKSIISDMLAIFEAKDQDYASNGKPMGNLRTSEEIGIPAWKGTLLRMGDKKQRIASFASRGEFKVDDERIADTLKDLANYACLGSVLFGEMFDNEDGRQIQYHFCMLAVKAIHCKVLSECELNPANTASWKEKPLTELNQHFDSIAEFARSV
jgi:hypothetical protein